MKKLRSLALVVLIGALAGSVHAQSVISGFGGNITGKSQVATLPTALVGTSASFPVGGVLSIPANTPAGQYSGTYTVAVNYP